MGLDLLKEKTPIEYQEFLELKQKIFELMEKADNIAENLRENILD